MLRKIDIDSRECLRELREFQAWERRLNHWETKKIDFIREKTERERTIKMFRAYEFKLDRKSNISQ